jgi:hypothetical protein
METRFRGKFLSRENYILFRGEFYFGENFISNSIPNLPRLFFINLQLNRPNSDYINFIYSNIIYIFVKFIFIFIYYFLLYLVREIFIF